MGRACMRPTSVTKQEVKTAGSEKRRDQIPGCSSALYQNLPYDTNERLLVIGGSWQDVELLICAGFNDITLSNFQSQLEEDAHTNLSAKVKLLACDAEQVDLPDGSLVHLTASSLTKSCTIAGPRTEPCVKCYVSRASMLSCCRVGAE